MCAEIGYPAIWIKLHLSWKLQMQLSLPLNETTKQTTNRNVEHGADFTNSTAMIECGSITLEKTSELGSMVSVSQLNRLDLDVMDQPASPRGA